ncbi:MAG: hypothetical protein ACOCRK_10215 [bacterium]
MSDIYKNLDTLIFQDKHDNLNIYNGHKDLIKKYLLDDQSYKNAKELLGFVSKVHKKNYVFNLMEELKLYESKLERILPKHREHYKHSVNVYILGLAIYNNCELIRNAVKTPRHLDINNDLQRKSFLFRWSLAAGLHDLAYPLEMSIKTFNEYLSYLNKYQETDRREITIKKSILDYFNIIPILDENNLPYSIPKETAIGLISNFILTVENANLKKEVGFEELNSYLNKEIQSGFVAGKIDHGIFSSLIMLRRIYELYERNNDWDVHDFYYEVVDSATAIFLHNFHKYSNINNLLGYQKFNYDGPSSLGYLLTLCDEMCEWDRDNQNDSEKYCIDISDEIIRFSVPREKRQKLTESINLLNKDIEIYIV